jgi:hypothetical protein
LFGIAAFGWRHLTIAILIVLLAHTPSTDGIFLVFCAPARFPL